MAARTLAAGFALAFFASFAAAQFTVGPEVKLTPSDSAPGDRFGSAVASFGPLLVVGAPFDEDGGIASGSAYVFTRSGNVWTQTAKLLASRRGDGDRFGAAIAIRDDLILIGAPGDVLSGSSCTTGEGSVSVFTLVGASWVETATLTAPVPECGGELGASVAFSRGSAMADTAGVGAPGTASSAGRAFVYEFDGAIWDLVQVLSATDGGAFDRFGAAIAFDGVSAPAVGAPFADGATSSTGAVYRYGSGFNETKAFDPNGFPENEFGAVISDIYQEVGAPGKQEAFAIGPFTPPLTPLFPAGHGSHEPRAEHHAFGSAVARGNNVLAVGAPYSHFSGSLPLPGFVLLQDGSTSTQVAPSDGVIGDQFGAAITLADDFVIVGAPFHEAFGALPSTFAGAVYVYELLRPYESFCHGDGGDQLGCTPCPCGNEQPQGGRGGCSNTMARSAELFAHGSASVSQPTLRFEMADAAHDSFAVLTSGASRAPANAANPCFGQDSGITAAQLDGLRCVVQNVLRHGVRPVDFTGATGLFANAWGSNAQPIFGSGTFVAGQTRHFQAIFRDPFDYCGTQQNTSNGVTVAYQP